MTKCCLEDKTNDVWWRRIYCFSRWKHSDSVMFAFTSLLSNWYKIRYQVVPNQSHKHWTVGSGVWRDKSENPVRFAWYNFTLIFSVVGVHLRWRRKRCIYLKFRSSLKEFVWSYICRFLIAYGNQFATLDIRYKLRIPL